MRTTARVLPPHRSRGHGTNHHRASLVSCLTGTRVRTIFIPIRFYDPKLDACANGDEDMDGDNITVDGTLKLCEDLGVDPEDVVLLAVAYELKSPRMAEWTRKGWIEGWKNVKCVIAQLITPYVLELPPTYHQPEFSADTTATMKTALLRLRDKLGSDAPYFHQVYAYTFDFARAEGQRSLSAPLPPISYLCFSLLTFPCLFICWDRSHRSRDSAGILGAPSPSRSTRRRADPHNPAGHRWRRWYARIRGGMEGGIYELVV